MTKPFVSVLIDTYNHERFIEQAITSVLEQDFSAEDAEILVVDDGSTDSTPEIVRKFEPRVRLLRKENGGQASAFNAGIPECRGEIIAFLDGDDWWAPGKLRAVAAAMESEPGVGIVGNGIIQAFDNGDQDSEVLQVTPRFRADSVAGARIFRRRKSQLGTSRMTLRADLARRILPIPEAILIEADEFLFTLAAVLSDVWILGQALTFYRIHGGNLYQMSRFHAGSQRRKQKSLEALVSGLLQRLASTGLQRDVINAILEPVQAEADQTRLQIDGGFPWETVGAEWKWYRVVHEDAPWPHRLFKRVTLLPALLLPPKFYYQLRRELAASKFYLRAREIVFPVPRPQHVIRSRRSES